MARKELPGLGHVRIGSPNAAELACLHGCPQVRDLYCDPRTEPDVWKTPLGVLYLDGPIHVFRHPAVLKVWPSSLFRAGLLSGPCSPVGRLGSSLLITRFLCYPAQFASWSIFD